MTATALRIEGLPELRARLGAAPAVLEGAMRIAIRRGITTMRARGRAHAATLGKAPFDPRLANSVQMAVVGGGLTGFVGSVAASAVSIEQGRAPGEHVPVGLVLGWINRSGIVSDQAAIGGARQSVKTHAVVNRKRKSVAAAQRHLAWKIAMAIGVTGTKPLPFLTPVVGESKIDVQRYFQEAVTYLVKKLAAK